MEWNKKFSSINYYWTFFSFSKYLSLRLVVKAHKGVFLRFSERFNAYGVYNSETHVIEESMHIKFDDKEPGSETPEQDESFPDTSEPDQIEESKDSPEAEPTSEAQDEVASKEV